MKIRITPGPLSGRIRAIASKSQAHRLLICAAFADGPTDILCRELSADIEATAHCLEALGCGVSYDKAAGIYHVVPCPAASPITLDVGESGSTLRFLLPVVCALGLRTRIMMHGRLPERPLSPLWEELMAHGAVLGRNPDGSVETAGRLTGSSFTIAANISSQFISGLLFALPLIREEQAAGMSSAENDGRKDRPEAPGSLRLRLTGQAESVHYIRMTIDALKLFRIEAKWNEEKSEILIPAGAAYRTPGRLEVEGDWSNGAFWHCARAIGSAALEVTGLAPDSSQGDRAVLDMIRRIRTDRPGHRVEIDARDVPDLVPVLSVLAASVCGETVFTHAERLRIKESDRIRASAQLLHSLGGRAEETADGLIVYGTGRLAGGSVDSCNDHRIAMSAAVASLLCEKEVTILGAEAVRKSYPRFWEDFEALGGYIRRE